ncbi:MAG TPA: hypothetical protein VGE36_13525 [Roseateles sp.]
MSTDTEALRKALHDAATSLETLSHLAGRETFGDPPIETYLDSFTQVRGYAASRAGAAREALADRAAERYSLDADRDGIRSLVAVTISGAIAKGAQDEDPAPEGHWLAEFWKMGRTADQWRSTVWAIARALNCLPSTFADANGHVLKAAIEAQAARAGDGKTAQDWEGADEWMPLAWELCANEHGEEACTELIWEGGPIPEPWGDRWLKYEDQAKEMIAMVRKHVPAAALAEMSEERRQLQHLVDDIVEEADQDGHTYYRVRDGADVLFSNMVGACARLLAQPAAAPAAAPAWQPIETAPTDGRKLILFYLNRNGKARTVMARWVTDEEAAETDADGVGLEGGWYECIDNWDEYSQVTIHEGEPSHWQPLPAAPASQAPATAEGS